jgi:hypothetical protein
LFNCFDSGDKNISDLRSRINLASQPESIDGTITGTKAVASTELLGLGLVVGEEKTNSVIEGNIMYEEKAVSKEIITITGEVISKEEIVTPATAEEKVISKEEIVTTPTTAEEKVVSKEEIVTPLIALTSIDIIDKERATSKEGIIITPTKAIDKEGIITPTIGATTAVDIINEIMLNDSVKNKTKIINDVNKIIEENIKIKNELNEMKRLEEARQQKAKENFLKKVEDQKKEKERMEAQIMALQEENKKLKEKLKGKK